jgi:selenide,water dikinase
MALDAQPRLTDLSHGAGCACKIGPGQLREVLAQLPQQIDAALLVGSETCDDAGVYRISEDLALVQTVDFFTPIVDDPRDFGRIAAANALSDVYAMGASPLTALNLVGFSIEKHGSETLAAILAGGAEIAAEAGVPIIGGHSIDDEEPKYGMAVTGVVHPSKVVRNSTGRARDVLFLTKPIGSGAVTTAAKLGIADALTVRRCTAVMTTLNAKAARAAVAVGASAMTDVTGFGLLGHLHELALASGVAARVEAVAVPAIDGALELLEAGALAGGSRRNREWLEPHVKFAETLSEPRCALLCDSMTSGGLLVATPPERAAEMERALADVAPHTARIGHLQSGPAGRITVV